MSRAVNPHIGYRTHFSLGESVLTPGDIVELVKASGFDSFAVCDTMNLSSTIELTKKATKEGLRPSIGVRFRVLHDLVREKGANNKAVMVKAFPVDERGQRQLYELLTKAFAEDHFYEVPRLAWRDIEKLSHGHLIWTTGDLDGLFGSPHGPSHLDRMVSIIPAENLYVELVPINTPFFDRFNAEAILACKRHALEPVLTSPALYREGEFESFFVSLAIQKKSIISKAFTVYAPVNEDAHTLSERDLISRALAAKERVSKRYTMDQSDFWKRGIMNAQAFLDRASYVWKKQEVSLPKMAEDPDLAVAAACSAGMKDRLFKEVNGYRPTPDDIRDVYIPRLKYELGVLRDLKFATYFLVVSDVVVWSKDNGILVGPGRGSVGGSLVAYLMGITDVDPIRFGLLFERFINPSRNDLPDADLDFMSTRRHEVVDYLVRRHGEDYVAGISNYGVLGSASAIRDVARVFGHNVMEITVSKLVPKVHGQPVDLVTAAKEVAEIEKWGQKHEDEWRNAVKLEGTMRSYGKHAAGIIVSGVPLTDRAVVERREGAKVINWNMAVSEDAGLVKLDILGLSTLDTLSRALRYIQDRHKKAIDLSAIPLDCTKTLALFATGRTQGVFQFEGGAARRILKDMAKVNPLSFDDLVAANALNRPGPIEAGLVKQYVDAKNGDAKIEVAHPAIGPALAETFNVICYQEQVMRISVDLCGFDLSEADKLRKAMGKKDPVLMASYRDKFVDGAVGVSGMDRNEAGELFDQIEKFAGYAFNKSHAVEYSLISYQCAWLKAHYPVEFFAAALSTVDEDKLPPLVDEAAKLDIKVLPPDVNVSTGEFVIADDHTLYIPFNRVKGISDKATNAIIAGREAESVMVEEKTKVGRRVHREMVEKSVRKGAFESVEDFRARIPGGAVNVRHMETLQKIGAFHRIEPGSLPVMHEERRRDQHELIPGLMAHDVVIGRYIDPSDKYTKIGISNVFRDMDAEQPKAVNVHPYFGKNAAFVAVFDAPNRSEEQNKKIASSESFNAVAEALYNAGMDRNDGYWTALVKKTKSGAMLNGHEIGTYAPYLERELDVLKPPLIIALGSNAARYFVPDIKGSALDYVGKVFYDRKRDANILIGFTPGMIYHDPDKQILLDEVFERAARLMS